MARQSAQERPGNTALAQRFVVQERWAARLELSVISAAAAGRRTAATATVRRITLVTTTPNETTARPRVSQPRSQALWSTRGDTNRTVIACNSLQTCRGLQVPVFIKLSKVETRKPFPALPLVLARVKPVSSHRGKGVLPRQPVYRGRTRM